MMKILICISFILLTSLHLNAQQDKKELRHVVMFGWKPGADSAAINRVVMAFKALPGKIKTIRRFEWGVNNSPENLNQGLTYCFLVTFASEKDRNDYIVNPDHKAFTQLLPDILDKVTVVDYWAQQ
ncbi:MAG TPA: Dabb family protein [Puia sp.]|nr:Dabb family protein [Puia sp.]